MRSPALSLVVIAASLAPAVRAQSPCFEDDRPLPIPGIQAAGVALGDLDGDGDLDLVACQAGGFRVHSNAGDGTFDGGVSYAPTSFDSIDVKLSDVDQDGDLDALFANRAAGGSVVLWRNAGNGTMALPTTFALETGANPRQLVLGDIDGDGDPDLISLNSAHDDVSVFRNDGTGSYGPRYDLPVGDFPLAGTAGDIDGDGDLDVVVALMDGDAVGVFVNVGSGTFAPVVTFPTGLGPQGIALGDLDGDGDLDLATGSVFQNAVCIHTNAGGVFGPFDAQPTTYLTRQVAIADLDQDGDQDIAAGCHDLRVAVLVNRGADFAPAAFFSTAGATFNIVLADLDGDGDREIVTRNAANAGTPPSSVSILRNCTNSGRAVCSGDGSATPCPCGPGAPGRGCPTSFEPRGALLAGTGSAQVADDGLRLACEGVSPTIVTFFQGTAIAGGNSGVVFGDGLRCAGGTTIRIAPVLATGGAASYPGPGDAPISQRGQVPAAGGTRTYQVWFRNAADFCTSATFNLTNGLALAWAP